MPAILTWKASSEGSPVKNEEVASVEAKVAGSEVADDSALCTFSPPGVTSDSVGEALGWLFVDGNDSLEV